MLEEKNDNLLATDGHLETNSIESVQPESTILDEIETVQTSNEIISETEEVLETLVSEVEIETTVIESTELKEEIVQDIETPMVEETATPIEEPIVIAEIETAPIEEIESEKEIVQDTETPIVEETATAVEEPTAIVAEETSETNTIIEAIADINAEESEDETLKDRHEIPMLDYDSLSLESLIDELKNLVVVEKVMSVKDHVEEIKKAFLAKYYHLLDEKKKNSSPKIKTRTKNSNITIH